MPAKPSVNKCDEHNSMVNRHIGTAYDNVRIVAEHIAEVITMSEGIEPISLYLGAFSAPPSEGWNNEPLKSGNFYLNTTENTLDYYDADEMIWVSVDEETVVQAAQTAVAARDAALLAQVAAELAETNAESSAAAALLSEQNAALSEANSAASATAAATSETNAATSEANALASENAAKASETAAALSESNAATSASNASTSETNAAASASSASTSASNAATSETNAATSETNAATSASNAATSEANALASANAAATSETNASNSETNAALSASDASGSAIAASNSETNAANSASAAQTSASQAATSEANAATSETNAATSASNAATSETNAATSAANAEQAYQDTLAVVPSLQSQIDNRTTYADVGIPNDDSAKAAAKLTGGSAGLDWDTLETPGFWNVLAGNTSTNGPGGGTGHYYPWVLGYGSTGNVTQVAWPYGVSGNNGKVSYRTKFSGVYNPWVDFYTTDNKPTAQDVGAYTTAQVDTIETGLQNQITTLDGEVVKTSGDQTISGAKTFTTNIITATIRETVGGDQGFVMFNGGSTRIGGSGSIAGIQVRPNGMDVASDTDYYNFQPNGLVEYEGASNFGITRSNASQGFHAHADGRTFITGANNSIELRPISLADASKRFVVGNTGAVIHEHSGGPAYRFRDAVAAGVGSSSYFEWQHSDESRRGFIGFGSSGNENMTWFNDNGNANVVLRDDGNVQLNSGSGNTIILSGTSISDRYEASGAAGGSWGHAIGAALTLTGSNSALAYNVFKMGSDGPKMQALGEGGNTVRLYPAGSNQDFTYWQPALTRKYYTGTDPMYFDLYATNSASRSTIRYYSNSGVNGMEAGYAADSANGEYFINTRFSNSVNRALSIYRDRTKAIFNTEELRVESNGATKLDLYRSDGDANVNIRFDASANNPLYFGRSGTALVMGASQNLSDTGNQWILFNSTNVISRVPLYLPGTNPTASNMAARKAYVDTIASDERLKSNIKSVDDALSIVNQIPVHTYLKEVVEYNEESEQDEVVHKYEYGFIAQEMEQVLPHLVKEREDGMKTILRTGNDLHALSFGSIQQLKAENDELKAKNQELEERLAAIEAKLGL